MIKEIDGKIIIRGEKCDYTIFVMEKSGRAYIVNSNRPKPKGNVSSFRGGAFPRVNDITLECPYLTEDDVPKRYPDGYFEDGEEGNRAWICPVEEWMGLYRLNADRAKEERKRLGITLDIT